VARGRYTEEALRDLRKDLQDTLLGNERGQRVLEWLLIELGLFDEIVTEEEQYLHNFAVRLLMLLGIYEPWQIRGLVRRYAGMPRSASGEKKAGKDMVKEEQ
jgi:hypothetical protein